MTLRCLRMLPFLLVGLFFSAAAAAPSPSPSAPAKITAGVKETILPNGLRVLTKEVHAAPVVSVSVWYRVGSRNEHTGITGTSHLLEHLMFKGTKRYGLGEISRMLFVNGATYNAGTYYDWTNYWETLAADRMELALQIESDRMLNSRIDRRDLDSEMSVVRSELEGNENDPGTFLSQAVAAAAFQAHPYQWPVIGWRSDVENVPRDAIYRYYRSHYGPNNATLIIVGDFRTAPTLALVKRYFGSLPRIPTPPPVYTKEPAQRGERRVEVRRAGTLPMVEIAYHAPEAKSPDFYALDALSTILSAGRTSRLYQDLIEKQIAVSADAGAPSLRDPYLFMFSATAQQGVAPDRVEKALLDEVERLKSTPVTDTELNRAKTQIESQFIFNQDSVTAQANQLGYWAMEVDWRYLSTYLDRIRALAPADLQRVAQKYFTEENRTVGRFIPTEGGSAAPPPREASARVEPPKRGDRPVPLPKPSKTAPVSKKVARFTLDNGIRLIVDENHTTPTFAIRGSIGAGSIIEPQDKPGLAGITASMLSRGTEKHSALEFAAALENIGAAVNVGPDTLSADIGGHAQSKDFGRVMDLLAEMLRRPAFPEEQLRRLKARMLAGLEQEKEDPDSLAARAFGRSIYPEGNPLRPKTLEEEQHAIADVTREDVEQFYRRQYGPDQMILVVVGDVRPDQVRQAVQSRFGSWPRNPGAQKIPSVDVPLAQKASRLNIQVPDKSQTAILFGHAGMLRRSAPDFYVVQVLNMIVGGGGALNSRLGTAIRDQQGLAYNVVSFVDASLYPGPFEVSLGTNPANAERAIKSLEAEIRRVREHGVTQREVDEAVAYITGRFPLRLETNAGLAEILWVAEFYRLGSDYIDRYPGYYRAVTVQQVNQAARKYLRPDVATLVVAGTPATPAPVK